MTGIAAALALRALCDVLEHRWSPWVRCTDTDTGEVYRRRHCSRCLLLADDRQGGADLEQ